MDGHAHRLEVAAVGSPVDDLEALGIRGRALNREEARPSITDDRQSPHCTRGRHSREISDVSSDLARSARALLGRFIAGVGKRDRECEHTGGCEARIHGP